MAAAAQETAPEEERPVGGSGGRVLVVDDNVDAATLLAELVRTLGYEAEVAHDGGAALEVAERFRPGLVLLDIGLPVLDGHEVARRLRARPEFAGLRLVALTGYGGDADRTRSQEAGFDLHLVKPVELDQLLEALALLSA